MTVMALNSLHALQARARWAVTFLVLGCLAEWFPACASTAGSIEIEQLKDDTVATNEYVIGVGDMLSIQVYNDDKASGKVRVRSDGKISLQFLNDVEAAGKTPVKLAGEIETALKTVIINPQVTVVVEESRPMSISVLGEVMKPGLQTLDRGAGVFQALAAAGGLSNFAHKDRIFVVRSNPQPTRIRFRYEALTRTSGRAPLFRLRAGDIVVVE